MATRDALELAADPEAVDREPFTFRPCRRQRKRMYAALRRIERALGYSSVPAMHFAARWYLSLDPGELIADPERTRRSGKPTAAMDRHFFPHQALDLRAAIRAATANGCEDDDHALAHILDTAVTWLGLLQGDPEPEVKAFHSEEAVAAALDDDQEPEAPNLQPHEAKKLGAPLGVLKKKLAGPLPASIEGWRQATHGLGHGE